MKRVNLYSLIIAGIFMILIFSCEKDESDNNHVTKKNVLIIYDDSISDPNTLSLGSSLNKEGYIVKYSDVSEILWDNTNPSLDNIDVVIHLNGTTYDDSMTVAGQLALVDFVKNKGGYYVGSEWNAYEISEGRMTEMQDLILFDRSSGRTAEFSYVKVEEQTSHPVLNGINNFLISEGNGNVGSAHIFDTEPSVVLMTEETNDAIVVREFGSGKVLGFHHSGNYDAYTHFSDENIQKIIINFIEWNK